jgi:hypothetical protein
MEWRSNSYHDVFEMTVSEGMDSEMSFDILNRFWPIRSVNKVGVNLLTHQCNTC